jgi:signal transduction histidine kinase
MKPFGRKPYLMLLLVAALAALLPILAFVQYRWLGEVSRAERERMQASLKTAVSNFSQEFDREITRAYIGLQLDAASLRGRDWQAFAGRYNRWAATAAHPEIVSDVFIVEPGEDRHARLLRYDTTSARFEPADWPAPVEELRAHFERAFQEKGPGGDSTMSSALVPVPDHVAALVTPIPDRIMIEQRIDPHYISVAGYVVTVFDMGYLTNSLIPSLTEKYFAGGDGVDYNLAIVTRGAPRRIIYQNRPEADADLEAADATSALFGPRLDTSSMIEETLKSQSSAGATAKQGRLSVQVITGGGKDEGSHKVAQIALMTTGGARWEAVLRHRAGSLDAAVASARRKNLIISFGVLILLGASVALIVVSTRRAERLARQQMEFVAGVSHEMRTPLAVIRSAGENLADGLVNDREQVRRYGSLIEGEGRRLTEMVEQALEFAGIQSGHRAYDAREVNIKEMIESSLAACQPMIAEGGFEVEKDIAIDLPAVAADPPALGRAIQNVLNNAIKYSRESRRIRVSARKSAGGDEVLVMIEDFGMGIPHSEMSRVFEPFYRGREAVAAQIHGNGLGLSLVKHTVEAHGGRVTVESAQGKGCSFTLHLPVMRGRVPGEQVRL